VSDIAIFEYTKYLIHVGIKYFFIDKKNSHLKFNFILNVILHSMYWFPIKMFVQINTEIFNTTPFLSVDIKLHPVDSSLMSPLGIFAFRLPLSGF